MPLLRTARVLLTSGLASVALSMPCVAVAQDTRLRTTDLEDRPIDAYASTRELKAIVFVFTTVDCPISNRYAPELRRVADRFGPQGVKIRLVYPNPADRADAIREHLKSFGYPADAIRDPFHDLVRLASATVTPEVAVYDHARRLVYRGRIDDRYAAIGIDRQTPRQRDLENALARLLDGKPMMNVVTRAVGCVIADFRADTAGPDPVTFTKDIAPIVFDRCVACHRPGGAAPFSLITYEDVRQRASLVAAVTRTRYMPPWKAEPGHLDFVGQRHLSDREIDLFRQWVASGAPEGDRSAMPSPPTFVDGWQLGTPDLIVSLDHAFELPANGSDVFRIFVLPLPVTETRYVRGLEFRPGNARAVHHANIRIDRTARSRELDAQDPGPGYDGLLARTAEYPDGHFFGWTPGQLPGMLPGSLAWRLDPGTDLVIQAHMQPTGRGERVATSVGLYFASHVDAATIRTPAMLRLGRQTIDIAPQVRDYTITDTFVLPVDVEVLAVQPHAHYLAKSIRGTATLPDGSTRWLIDIKDWDFRWQHVYRLATPLPLPKGTTLSMVYTYDNSAENPRNPRPTAGRVTWGQRSFDEMGDLWIQVLTRDEADLATLKAAFRPKVLAEDAAGYEMVIRNSAPDAALHEDVALLYLDLGKMDAAITHFETALKMKPNAAPAHFNLATALTYAGRLDRAVAEYRAALTLDPNYANAHNNLGSVLLSQGRRSEALTHFREAVRSDPSNAMAHRNLAWELATDGSSSAIDVTNAIRLAERAADLTGRRDPGILDAVAVAYAAAGEYERALSVADAALGLRPAEPLARDIRERRELYRQRKPFRVQPVR